MPTDIFSREAAIGQPYKAESSTLLLPDSATALVVQSMNIQYQQQISRIWEIGSNKQYFIGGRTQGNLQMGSVVGPTAINSELLRNLGDVCKIKDDDAVRTQSIGFQMGNPCKSDEAVAAIMCLGCVLTSVGFRVASADMVVNQDMTVMFAHLKLYETLTLPTGNPFEGTTA